MSPFDPTQIGGLSVWLDASQLTQAPGAAIPTWPNLSQQPQTVTFIGSPQPIVSPTLKNGLKVVQFTHSQAALRINGTGVDKEYTLVYIARMLATALPGAGRIVCAIYNGVVANLLFGWWNTNMDTAYATPGFLTPDGTKPTTTDWIQYSADASATPAYFPRLFRNGTFLSGTVDATGARTDGFGGTFAISGFDPNDVLSVSDETSDCEVAEVCLYNHKLADVDRQRVESYLWEKWLTPTRNLIGTTDGIGASYAIFTSKRRLAAASTGVASAAATVTRRRCLIASASGTTTANAVIGRVRTLAVSISGKATASGTISKIGVTSPGPDIVYSENLVPVITSADQLVPYIYTSAEPMPAIYNGEYLAPNLYAKDVMVPIIVRSEEI